MPRASRWYRFTLGLALAAGGASFGCTDGTGPEALGQLRLRPVFAPGEEPETLGIALSQIRFVLRRTGGAIVADTTLPYTTGDTTSWLIDITDPPESVGVSASLGQAASTMYAGSGQVPLAAGIGPSSTMHDLPVQYLGGPGATFVVDVSPDSAGISSIGSTQRFTAVARDSNATALTGFSFNWSSSRPDVATIDAATGIVTAVAGGRAQISATSGGVVGTAVLTVETPGVGIPVAVIVTPDRGVLGIGDIIRFSAVAIDVFGTTVPGTIFTWTSSSVVVASVAQTGLSTALSAGQTWIIASLGALADSALLTVNPRGSSGVASIEVSPPSATLTTLSSTQQFTATARDASGTVVTGVTFVWRSSNVAVATVSGAGVATAQATGLTTISATSQGVTGSASLTVSLGVVPTNPVVSIAVIPGAGTISALGDRHQFVAVALDAQGRTVPGVPFTWTSSDPAVAAITAHGGLVTGIAPGAVTIVASVAAIAGTASLTVSQVVREVTVSPSSANVVTGASTPFAAVARDANGHIIPGTVFSWSTADPSIATVSNNGVVTGVAGGNTLVQATAAGATGAGAVSVTAIGSIQIQAEEENHLKVGNSLMLTAIVRDAAGNVLQGVPVTWSVTNPIVASIDPVTGVATGLTTGLTLVRATVGGVSDQVALVILP